MKDDPRYGKTWDSTSAKAIKHTHGRCSRCFIRKASSTHHLRYCCSIRGRLNDKEIIGIDVIPLCRRCHGWAHRHSNWMHDEPLWQRRQKCKALVQLLIGYRIRRLPLEWIAFAIGVVALLLANALIQLNWHNIKELLSKMPAP
jgi:hypothetical protein